MLFPFFGGGGFGEGFYTVSKSFGKMLFPFFLGVCVWGKDSIRYLKVSGPAGITSYGTGTPHSQYHVPPLKKQKTSTLFANHERYPLSKKSTVENMTSSGLHAAWQ